MSVGNAFHTTSWCTSWPSERDTLPSTTCQNGKFRRWRKANFHSIHLIFPLPVCSGGILSEIRRMTIVRCWSGRRPDFVIFKFRPWWDGWQDREACDTGRMGLPVWLLMGHWHTRGWRALNMSCLRRSHAAYETLLPPQSCLPRVALLQCPPGSLLF